MEEERSDRKDRCNVISFDYYFTTGQGEPDGKLYATALYAADSETKAVLCLPVAAKGSVSLRQATEELLRFSLACSNRSRAEGDLSGRFRKVNKTAFEGIAACTSSVGFAV